MKKLILIICGNLFACSVINAEEKQNNLYDHEVPPGVVEWDEQIRQILFIQNTNGEIKAYKGFEKIFKNTRCSQKTLKQILDDGWIITALTHDKNGSLIFAAQRKLVKMKLRNGTIIYKDFTDKNKP